MPGFQSTQLATEGALEPFFFLYTDDSIQGNPETCKQSSIMLNYAVKNSRSEVLMQEEVTQKTIALVIKTAKLDANVLKAAMRMYLNHRRQKAQKTHGKTSVKKLVGEGVGVSSIEVTDGNIKSFERVYSGSVVKTKI